MPDQALALLIAFGASLGATPLATRIAQRYRLLDHPGGWKQQGRPTPYLGGGAVMLAFFVAVLSVGGPLARYWPLLLFALLIWAVGTIDDSRGLPASPRLAIELGGGAVLWSADLGWSVFSSDVANLILTSLWIVAVVNATNLLDLMDGVAGTVACVASAGVGALAAIEGEAGAATLAFSLSGACAGFLRSNLRSPARIYLGDGGSMAIGFVLAGTIAALGGEAGAGWPVLLAAIPLFGVPLFDVALRVVLRWQRGIAMMTGGPDSVANWLEAWLRSPRKVAVALGAVQALLSTAAIAALQAGDRTVVSLSALCLLTALAAGRVVMTSVWARDGEGPTPLTAEAPAAGP